MNYYKAEKYFCHWWEVLDFFPQRFSAGHIEEYRVTGFVSVKLSGIVSVSFLCLVNPDTYHKRSWWSVVLCFGGKDILL